MQPFRRQDVSLKQTAQRVERRADRAHRVGHGGQRNRHAFQRVALGLPVQRLTLPE